MHTKVSVQGAIIEVTQMDGRNFGCHAKKLDATHWMDAEGEIHEYEKCGDKRTDNAQELRATFRKIRALINTNCTDARKIRWITLTYAENMTDTERLYKDFEKFWKRFKRRWGKSRMLEYIAVVEPQARGAWHIHLIAIYTDRGVAPFIPNDELRECWGWGFVKVKAVKDIDNIGAYLSAYLGDVEVGEGEAYTEEKECSDGTKKRILKGGRLHMYPKGMNIYRCSRGVKRPEEFWCEETEEYERARELTRDAACTYMREFVWTDEDGREHRVVKTFYNRNREKDGRECVAPRMPWDDEGQDGADGMAPVSGGHTEGTQAWPPDRAAHGRDGMARGLTRHARDAVRHTNNQATVAKRREAGCFVCRE